jgi:hypothetical protein
VEGSGLWQTSKFYRGICLERLRKATKYLSQDMQWLWPRTEAETIWTGRRCATHTTAVFGFNVTTVSGPSCFRRQYIYCECSSPDYCIGTLILSAVISHPIMVVQCKPDIILYCVEGRVCTPQLCGGPLCSVYRYSPHCVSTWRNLNPLPHICQLSKWLNSIYSTNQDVSYLV